MGRSGQAVLDACVADGILVNVFDDEGPTSRTETCFRNFNDWDMDGLEAMVISPGIPHLTQPLTRRQNAAWMRAFQLSLKWNLPFGVGVRDVGYLLQGQMANHDRPYRTYSGESRNNSAVGGNIGAAVTALKPVGADGVNVIELSSYQLETTPSLRSDSSDFEYYPGSSGQAWRHDRLYPRQRKGSGLCRCGRSGCFGRRQGLG